MSIQSEHNHCTEEETISTRGTSHHYEVDKVYAAKQTVSWLLASHANWKNTVLINK